MDPRLERPNGPTQQPWPADKHGHRQRMMWAMIDLMVRQGYVDTTPAQIAAHAGCPVEAFDELFTDKADAFMSAYEDAVNATLPSIPPPELGPPIERVRVALARYIGLLSAQPTIARLFLLEIYSAGPDALRRREAVLNIYSDALVEVLGLEEESDRFAGRSLIAAISTMVTVRLASYDVDGIRELEAPLLELAERIFDRN